MPTTTDFPNLFSGQAVRNSVNETLASIIAGDGTTSGHYSDGSVQLGSTSTSGNYGSCQRPVLTFDTSALTAGVAISAASLFLYCPYYIDQLGGQYFNVVSSNPASDDEVVAADYQTLGTVKFSDDVTIDGHSTGWLEFVLNAAGIAAISKTGITKLGLRITADGLGGAITWSSSNTSDVDFRTDLGENPPYLHITYADIPPVSSSMLLLF